MTHHVVIGAGQAGFSVAAGLRAGGFTGRITLVGAEDVPPYQRPPLSKGYLLGEIPEERLFLRPPAFYAENDIDLRLSTRATGLDTARREVRLGDGSHLAYDDLVLATGAHPRGLPAAMGGTLAGVHTVRDLRDVDEMAPRFVAGARVLVVGGGYIGLEAAAVAATRGLHVTLIEAAPRILARVAAAQTSDWFRALHAGHGVHIREGTGLGRLIGDDTVTAAVLGDGTTIPVDFVIAGIGVTPATILADSAGIALDNGIACDAYGRSSDPHVWAAGDCASVPLPDGRRIRLESVGNAIDMAETVAANLLGAARPYLPRPWFWSDQFDCKLQIAGLNTGYDAVHVRPGATGAMRSHWYYARDRLIAVDAMNDPRSYMIGKRLIEAGRSVPPALVTDPASDLMAAMRAP